MRIRQPQHRTKDRRNPIRDGVGLSEEEVVIAGAEQEQQSKKARKGGEAMISKIRRGLCTFEDTYR